jgi:hypothetical protein
MEILTIAAVPACLSRELLLAAGYAAPRAPANGEESKAQGSEAATPCQTSRAQDRGSAPPRGWRRPGHTSQFELVALLEANRRNPKAPERYAAVAGVDDRSTDRSLCRGY